MTKPNTQFTLTVDQDLIPSDIPSQRVIEIAIQAPGAIKASQRPRLNLALVLDRSGSMSGEKLAYVKEAALHILDMLRTDDQVAVVVFDDEVNLLSPSVPVTDHSRLEIKRLLSAVRSGGSTNLSGGWLAGCQEVARAAQDGMINRTLLLTDGQANAGIIDLEQLAVHARELSLRGVSTTTFGVGLGFNEHLLEAMANQGSGNFYYIGSPSQIPLLFAREFSELATITSRNLMATLEIPAHVHATVLGGWTVTAQDGKLQIELGNLFSQRKQEVYVKLLIPPANGQSQLVFRAELVGRDELNEPFRVQTELTLTYASSAESEAAPRQIDMLQRFAGVDLAETATEALKLERNGERDKASRLLARALEEHLPFLDREKLREFERLSERMRHGMMEEDRKSSHQSLYNQKRRRDS